MTNSFFLKTASLTQQFGLCIFNRTGTSEPLFPVVLLLPLQLFVTMNKYYRKNCALSISFLNSCLSDLFIKCVNEEENCENCNCLSKFIERDVKEYVKRLYELKQEE